MHLLSYRSQSETELTRKLTDRGYSAVEIAEAMEKLRHYNYVNDEEYAEELFEAYRAKGTHGDSYIHRKLKEKGLTWEEHIPLMEEIEDCRRLLGRKAELQPAVLSSWRRAASFLARRGFSHSAVIAALRAFDFDAPLGDD